MPLLRRSRACSLVRAAWVLLGLVLLAPMAQAAVTVENVKVPERTAAARPFPVSMSLFNDGPARTVTLMAALYEFRDGEGPCGPATDARFRTFTHLSQERVDLPANARIAWPPEGRSWIQRYDARDVPARPDTMELCVFVARNAPGPQLDYEAFASVPLSVRAVNAPPTGAFSWSPETASATDDVVFSATGSDADGDPLAFRWDFGHANATGRAVATGPRAVHFFYPEGDYVVTLVVSDGMDETPVERGVRIGAPRSEDEVPAGVVEQARTPSAWWLPVAALALVALRRR